MANDIYVTKSGDTWDKIAYALWGDVRYTEWLMSNNQDPTLLATVIFDSGVTLQTPALPQSVVNSTNQPPWRTS